MSNSDSDVTVKISADIADLKSRMSEAQSSFSSGMSGIEDAVKSATAPIKDAFGGITATVFKFNMAVEAIKSVMAGGQMFTHAIVETQALNQSVNKLSISLGISKDQAWALGDSLEAIGSSSEAYLGSIQRMTMKLKSSEDTFVSHGVATRNASGELLNAQDVMQNTIKHLDTMKEGTDRNLEATLLLGRGWANTIVFGRLTKEMLEETEKAHAALGYVITSKSVEATYKYMAAMNDADDVFKASAMIISDTMVPRLTEMAKTFAGFGTSIMPVVSIAMQSFVTIMEATSDVISSAVGVIVDVFKSIVKNIKDTFGLGSESITAVEFFGNCFKVVALAVNLVAEGFVVTCSIIKTGLEELVILMETFKAIAQLVFSKKILNPAALHDAITASWQKGMNEIKASAEKNRVDLMDIDIKYAAARDKILNSSYSVKKGDAASSKGGSSYTGKGEDDQKALDAASALQLAAAEAELTQQKILAIQRTGHEMSKAEEEKYWSGLLETFDVNSKAFESISKKIQADTLADLKKGIADKKEATAKASADMLAAAENDLVDKKIAELQQTGHAMSKAEEKSYWEETIATHRFSTKELLAIGKKFQADKLAEATKAATQAHELQLMAVEEESKNAVAEYDAQLAHNKKMVTLGKMTGEEELAAREDINLKKYREEIRLKTALLALAEEDPVKQQKILNEMQGLWLKYSQDVQTINDDMAVAAQARWDGYFAPLKTAFDGALTGILQGTQSIHDAVSKMVSNIVASFTSMFAKMVTDWLAKVAMMWAATGSLQSAFAGTSLAGSAGSAAGSSLIGSITGSSIGLAIKDGFSSVSGFFSTMPDFGNAFELLRGDMGAFTGRLADGYSASESLSGALQNSTGSFMQAGQAFLTIGGTVLAAVSALNSFAKGDYLKAANQGLMAYGVATANPWIIAATSIAELFGIGEHGAPAERTGVATTTFDALGNVLERGANDTATQITASIENGYLAIAKSLDIQTKATQFYYESNTGRGGTHPNISISGGVVGGNQFATKATGDTFSGTEIAANQENLTLATSQTILTALQSSQIPAYMRGFFNSLDISSMTQKAADEALAQAQKIKLTHDTLITGLTETRPPLELLTFNLATGMLALHTTADTFKTDFVAALEKTADPAIIALWNNLGTAIDKIKQQIQGFIDSTHQMFASSAAAIAASIRTTEQQYAFLQNEAATMQAAIALEVDPSKIQASAQKINADMNAAFNLLSPEQKMAQASTFEANFAKIDDLVAARLNAVNANLTGSNSPMVAAQTQVEAANTMTQAANGMITAAQIIKASAEHPNTPLITLMMSGYMPNVGVGVLP